MASCRSRKIGNCSDSSKNKLLPQKAPETAPGSFPIPGLPAFTRRREGVARTMATEWHRRGKRVFYGLCMRLASGGGAGRNS